jgi:hypothetical protein
MCLAIYKPADTAPDWDAYRNGHEANNDSWGFAAAVNGRLVCHWGLGDFAEFRRAFEDYANCAALIHFRWATHGQTDIPNCHPFLVDEDRTLAMIHNGIVSVPCDLNKSMSDTWHFNELILRPLFIADPEFYKQAHIALTMEHLHDTSKFAFLRNDGDFYIWNREAGEDEDDGHWYSNTGYRRSTTWACGWSYGETKATYTSTSTRRAAPIARDEEEYVKWWHDTLDEDEGGARELALSRYEDSSVALEEDDDVEQELHPDTERDLIWNALREYGFSDATIFEVEKHLGGAGIEALYDLM